MIYKIKELYKYVLIDKCQVTTTTMASTSRLIVEIIPSDHRAYTKILSIDERDGTDYTHLSLSS